MKNTLQNLLNSNKMATIQFDNSSIDIVNKDTIKLENGGVLCKNYSPNGVSYYTFKPYSVIKGITVVGDGYTVEDYRYRRL